MARSLVSGNHAVGHTLAMAGEANREARGCVGGAYPITPQTEIVEYLRNWRFTKGRIVPVESEHSAMGVCIGGALAGARSFTASSSNGLAYMVENIFAAGYYRLPIILVAVNRTLGPPWNIWVDQGDSLLLRDAAWIQLYTDAHQDLVDTILLAFRVAEDPRVMLPALIAMDGFLTSHTQMVVDLPELEQVKCFLPPCRVPHQLKRDHPWTVGGLSWPAETEHHRRDIQAAMERVPAVLAEAIDEFERVFGRRPDGALKYSGAANAESLLIACNTVAQTARSVVEQRHREGGAVGAVKCKLFRPFPRPELRAMTSSARRIGVLDRNHSPGSGGIFWSEVATTLRDRPDVVVQDYLVGVGGGDVTPALVNWVLDDLRCRRVSEDPIWKEAIA